jgi:hypothetical protein
MVLGVKGLVSEYVCKLQGYPRQEATRSDSFERRACKLRRYALSSWGDFD